jgi:DNA/RNA-binding domain of Phe-tRNA-synthetase-like protein
MNTNLIFSLPPSQLRVGLIEAKGIKVKQSSDEYLAEINKDISHILQPDFIYPDHLKKGIRSLMKSFGYQPSGRNRPASEFLVKDLLNRKEFNSINNIVDINNHLSLKYHLPISILDLDKTGPNLCIRLGEEGENYIFNSIGQELSLKKLLIITSQDDTKKGFGSPVKDSHATKIFEEAQNVIGFVYTSANITSNEELGKILEEFKTNLEKQAKASSVEWKILDSPK